MSTQPTPTFGASGAEDITRIPVTGSSPRENYEVLIGHNLLGKIPEILGTRTKKVLVIHPRALRSTGHGRPACHGLRIVQRRNPGC